MKKLLPVFQLLLLLLLCSERISAQTFSQLTGWGNYTYAFLKLKDHLFLFANGNDQLGNEPWITDGTDSGTFLLKDINPGTASGISFNPAFNMVQLSDSVWLFAADDGVYGRELWRTNGTTAGTYLVKDVNAGSQPSDIYFNGGVNGKAFFRAWTGGNTFDTWVSDGTDSGTLKIVPGESNYFDGTVSGNQFYFFTQGIQNNSVQHLEVSDGILGNTILLAALPYDFGLNYYLVIPFENGVMFTGTDSINGTELWKTDGTFIGTSIVKDITPGNGSTQIVQLMAFDNKVFFVAFDSIYHSHIWTTDGTESGTQLFFPGDSLIQYSQLLRTSDSVLYFNTYYYDSNIDSTRITLWKTLGDLNTTTAIKNFMSSDQYVGDKTALENGKLLFTLNVEYYFGAESWLWITDGTTAGTIQLDYNPYNLYAQGPSFGNFHSLCDSFYLIDDSWSDYYSQDEVFASTAGDSLHHFDLIPGSYDHARILFADDEFIFLQLNKDSVNYEPALFAYTPCGIDLPTSDMEISIPDNVKIFPNPSDGHFTIQFNSAAPSSPITISIGDALGRTVFAEETIVNGNSLSIKLDEKISAGMYLVTIQSSQASFQKLLEVQK